MYGNLDSPFLQQAEVSGLGTVAFLMGDVSIRRTPDRLSSLWNLLWVQFHR